MSVKTDKAPRILDIYVRLCEGKAINKKEEAQRFQVDERSIQRDIDEIRKHLADRVVNCPGECRTIEYSREQKGFVLVGSKGSLMTNSEILAVSKILLESRAFTKGEMNNILDKMIAGCVPQKNMKLVSDLIANEKFHYVALRNSSAIKDKLWEIGEEVKAQNLLELSYRRGGDEGKIVSAVVQPLAVIFSEYYFYLIANIVKKAANGAYEKQYPYPAVYRIDRILEYREIGEKFRVDYANRFEEGIFRKRIQFMFQGKLMKLQFKYTGGNSEAVLNRLPTARILSEREGVYLIEAEVYGKGILMWLLSLGDMVEVIRPKELREEMKEKISNMMALYKD
ncbi:MAG: WYL domain-containing protein [Lachnospiraceae bacterium]|nr:WYL domain-containing protein [Lachnospiraceae bacterium]